MKSLFRGALIASLLATPALANEPSTDLEKLSYSLGIILGERIQNDFGDLDPNFVLEGLKDSKDPNSWKLDRPAINQAVQDAQTRIRAQQEQQVEAMAEANLKSGEAFLAENAKKDGVTVTASGLQYRVITEGAGDAPKATDTVKVHYEGRLISGDVFDSSIARGEPVSFPLNGVIPGWSEGVQLMKVGSKFEFTIPSALAYGPSGTGPIPPNSVLVFDVELLEINPAN
ncbi:FKBP-type peptidyl-prolyl cis-trans isomerase [Litorivicinus sp.]|jgi:FKBP-type peptidyl-prolyl cis-trans isomerase FklB|nr:FKBP-type peptidyl-prolyl cis-trans isomerase [Litorivicinus sp.]MCH1501902.1 FKBP-type peptidyl-prolyl cis-trans isomerase [Litorivicinaceae bacterium]MDA0894884.1 FKBP-type peptidyl-prolyl cis-trans isomerase [Pseudomonadota bacterium]HAB68271.1 peptidylprolyl isomerase [Gammaproteobacteria bacterium]MBL6809087.1 FKBP-type peptidyl-prolyl cis-trans isomerase [Litorivicinus sp.]